MADYKLDENYTRALDLIVSGRARQAFDLSQEPEPLREAYGKNAFGQSCLLARRLIEAGTRVVEVLWPNVANGAEPFVRHAHRPEHAAENGRGADARLGTVDAGDRSRPAGHARRYAGGRRRRIRPQPAAGPQHLGQRQQRRRPRPLALLLHRHDGRRRHQAGLVYGRSDKTGSAPAENPVHPTELLATVYYALGIEPQTIVYNHLKQPRELVKGSAVTALFA